MKLNKTAKWVLDHILVGSLLQGTENWNYNVSWKWATFIYINFGKYMPFWIIFLLLPASEPKL